MRTPLSRTPTVREGLLTQFDAHAPQPNLDREGGLTVNLQKLARWNERAGKGAVGGKGRKEGQAIAYGAAPVAPGRAGSAPPSLHEPT